MSVGCLDNRLLQACTPCQGHRRTNSAMTWLGCRVGLGRSVHLSDVGHIGLAARETCSQVGHYNTQHKALSDTPHTCPLDSSSTPLIHNVLNLRWRFWCTRHWTACHHGTWRTTVNSSQPLAAAVVYCCYLRHSTWEPAQLWAIDPSLLLVHICGTIYHFITVTFNYRFRSFAGYWKRICLAEDGGA